MTHHTIVLYPKLQVDTIAAAYLLRKFGEAKLPGASSAKLEFWSHIPKDKTVQDLEREGYILIDLGDSLFDHHKELVNGKPVKCATEVVAKYLEIKDDPALKKIIAFAHRDDLEGKGTLSVDQLDRAFGISGLITNLSKAYQHDLSGAVNLVCALFEAHYIEEEKRTKLMPQEWQRLKSTGLAKEWTASQASKSIRIVQIPCDDPSLPGFIRAYAHIDIVIVRTSRGHVNIITRQEREIDLSGIAKLIRQAEAMKKGLYLDKPEADLRSQGRLEEVPEWFYDTMATSLQNGGINPQEIAPTQLSDQEIADMVTQGLNS
jgi:hypothetical protein